jgi:hypothetical protein
MMGSHKPAVPSMPNFSSSGIRAIASSSRRSGDRVWSQNDVFAATYPGVQGFSSMGLWGAGGLGLHLLSDWTQTQPPNTPLCPLLQQEAFVKTVHVQVQTPQKGCRWPWGLHGSLGHGHGRWEPEIHGQAGGLGGPGGGGVGAGVGGGGGGGVGGGGG